MSATLSPPIESEVEILLVTCMDGDYSCLCHIVNHSNWKLYWVLNRREALAFLDTHPVGVVVANADLADGSWKDLLTDLAGLGCAPNLIISSPLADDQLWAEVLNLGAYDLLMTPFDSEEVFRVSSAAWLEWRRRLHSALIPAKKPLVRSASGQPNPAALAAASGY